MLAKTKKEKTKGIFALILLSFTFASMGIFARFLQNDFTILQQVYLRVFIAFILGFIIFHRDIDVWKLKKISVKEWGILMLRATSLYLLGVTLISYSFTIGKYSNISFVQALPFVPLLGFVILKEAVTKKKLLYLTIGFIGVIIISVRDYSNLTSWGHAEFISFVSGFFFALSYISRRWQGTILNNKEIAVLIFFLATMLLFATSLLWGEGIPHIPGHASILVALLGAGLFNVGNLFLTNYGFEKIESVIASNILTLELLFSIMFGFFLYHEIPSLKEGIGALLILISVYQMNKLS